MDSDRREPDYRALPNQPRGEPIVEVDPGRDLPFRAPVYGGYSVEGEIQMFGQLAEGATNSGGRAGRLLLALVAVLALAGAVVLLV